MRRRSGRLPATGSYRAPAWLPGGHAQTIWPHFLRRPDVTLRRELVDTPDGDVWVFDWLDGPEGAPLVVLFHGLEGDSRSPYVRALFHALRDVLEPNMEESDAHDDQG